MRLILQVSHQHGSGRNFLQGQIGEKNHISFHVEWVLWCFLAQAISRCRVNFSKTAVGGMEFNSGVMAVVHSQMVAFVRGGAGALPLEILGFMNACHTWMTHAWPTNLQSLGRVARSFLSSGALLLTEFYGSQEMGSITEVEAMRSISSLHPQEYDNFVCSLNSELESITSDVVCALQQGPLDVKLFRGRILAASKSLGLVAAQTMRDTGHDMPAWFVQLQSFLIKVESFTLQSDAISGPSS